MAWNDGDNKSDLGNGNGSRWADSDAVLRGRQRGPWRGLAGGDRSGRPDGRLPTRAEKQPGSPTPLAAAPDSASAE